MREKIRIAKTQHYQIKAKKRILGNPTPQKINIKIPVRNFLSQPLEKQKPTNNKKKSTKQTNKTTKNNKEASNKKQK